MGRMMNAVRRAIVNSALHTDSAVGNPIATFSTDVPAPLRSLVANITPYQAGSGDPTPDNMRSITGYTELSAYRTQKNLLDFPYAMDGATLTYNASRLSVSYSDGVITATVANDGSNTRDITITLSSAHQIALPKPTTGYLTMSFNHSGMLPNSSNLLRAQLQFSDGTTVFGNAAYNANRFVLSTASLNWPAGRTISGIYIVATYSANASIGDEIKFWNFQLEHTPSNTGVTDYAPSLTQKYAFTLPLEAGTVYGGTLDIVSGVLTVTHMIMSFDGTESWGTYSNNWVRKYYTYSNYNLKGGEDCICNMFANGGSTYQPSNLKFGYKNDTSSLYLTFKYEGVTDQGSTAWKNKLIEWSTGGTPLEIVLKYATPVEYTLTPQEVFALLNNNVWASTGDVALDYWKHG